MARLAPIRQALLVAVVAASVLNLWVAWDSLKAVSTNYRYFSLSGSSYSNQDVLVLHTPPPTCPPPRTPLDALTECAAAQENYDSWREARSAYDAARLRVWNRPAKIEFGIIAFGVILWLLLPRSKVLQ